MGRRAIKFGWFLDFASVILGSRPYGYREDENRSMIDGVDIEQNTTAQLWKTEK